MPERLHEQLAEAREHIDASFGAEHIERGLSGLERRVARRRTLVQASSTLGVLAVALALSMVWLGRGPAAPDEAYALRTDDGSVATRLTAESALTLEHDRPNDVSFALARGTGHFEVTRNPARRYRVRAGQVEVEVLGTAFEVERRGEQTHVRVEHGRVKVSWPGGSTLLLAGQAGSFPPAVAEPVERSAAEPVQPEEILQPTPASERGEKREPWRALARAGKHREAFGSLGQQRVDDLSGLLLAADAARLSGHPREAAGYLQQLMRRYPNSAPAGLAAFTLGRLALNELGDPALAAKSFARAYRHDPHGPLAEDALAREAEAEQRAGQLARAKRAAMRYIEQFPDGARRDEISRILAP